MTYSDEDPPSSALWDFATTLYRQPDVERALLTLQDDAGLDIPLLLALLQAGRLGCPVEPESLAAMLAAAHRWQEAAIGPLRKARRALARPIEGFPTEPREMLRTQIKSAEIEAERLLLLRLEELISAGRGEEPGAAIRSNLGAYLTALNLALKEEHGALLADLALAAQQA